MDVRAPFASLPLSADERAYLDCHAPRFGFAVALVRGLLPAGGRILDVGPHFLTELLRVHTGATVDQLGWALDGITRPRPGERHVPFDLNEAVDPSRWPALGPYDVVVAAEVIEHLHVSPRPVLALLRSALAPGGHLVLQTPNGVALKRRLGMALGRNPYELIRDDPCNPGHFREYTRPELEAYARVAGLEVVRFDARSYFEYRAMGGAARLYGAAARMLPAALRDGMTFVLRRPPAG